MVLDGIRLRVH